MPEELKDAGAPVFNIAEVEITTNENFLIWMYEMLQMGYQCFIRGTSVQTNYIYSVRAQHRNL